MAGQSKDLKNAPQLLLRLRVNPEVAVPRRAAPAPIGIIVVEQRRRRRTADHVNFTTLILQEAYGRRAD
jgi:hypothetical protein